MALQILNLLAIVSISLMIGVELCVAVFINPVLRRLPVEMQLQVIPLFAKRLGTAMPFWYAANFVILLVETYFHRGMYDFVQGVVATSIWGATILFTLFFLLPINSRLVRLDPVTMPDWQAQHRRWDILHYVRVALLLAAFVIAL